MACEVRIGTSGWQYRHWLGTFYPPETRASKLLETYATQFDTVEVNNTFYRLPAASVFDGWRKTSPQGFTFAVKGSRFLTHMRKLKEPEDSVRLLLERAERLEDKLGPVLFQLPPRWRCDHERLDAFLEALPSDHQYALELRDKSWHNDVVYESLRRRNVAFCIYDLAGYESPHVVTADFAYVRLHGPGERAYEGSYTETALERWVTKIQEWKQTLNAVYVYFDNDQHGYAPTNALQLRRMLS